MKRYLYITTCLLFAMAATCSAGDSGGVMVTIRNGGGDAVEGRLIKLTAEAAEVQRLRADGEVMEDATTLPLAEVEAIVFPGVRVETGEEEAKERVVLACRDGAVFGVKTLTLTDGVFQAETAWGDALAVREAGVQSVLLRPEQLEKADADTRKVWDDALAMAAAEDVLVVDREGKLSYYRGLVRGMTAEAVRFEMAGDAVNVRRDRVFGFVPAKKPTFTLPAATGVKAVLTDAEGNRWITTKFELADNKLAWQTPLGLAFTMNAEHLAELDFSDGKTVYLSSLKPESVVWTPFVSLPGLASREAYFMPRMNASINGNPLTMDGVAYPRGIGMTSRTVMTFRLPDGYSRLLAVVGMDDEVRPNGNATVVIRGDETELFREEVTGKDSPRAIDVEISKFRRLTFIVDYGQDMDISDHVDFGDVRIVK